LTKNQELGCLRVSSDEMIVMRSKGNSRATYGRESLVEIL